MRQEEDENLNTKPGRTQETNKGVPRTQKTTHQMHESTEVSYKLAGHQTHSLTDTQVLVQTSQQTVPLSLQLYSCADCRKATAVADYKQGPGLSDQERGAGVTEKGGRHGGTD